MMDGIVSEHRLLLPQFLSPDECEELEFIHKSCGVVGYRPWVLSTTLCHLVATNSANLILPLLPIRERVKEVVEEYFGREYELFTEFTGLISWTKGAKIGWHSDDNRPYLRQRHYSAVCYLNNYGEDFGGGLFHFEKGDPQTIIPTAGTIVIYTADEKNTHSVDKITEGERCTLALWFTLDKTHDEDEKLIQQLAALNLDIRGVYADQELEQANRLVEQNGRVNLRLPVSASSVMYNLNGNVQRDDSQGEGCLEQSSAEELPINDLRLGRMARLGFSTSVVTADEQDQPVDVFFRDKVVGNFTNLMHALQVIQFHQYIHSARQKNASSGEEPLKISKATTGAPVQTSPKDIVGDLHEESEIGHRSDTRINLGSSCKSLIGTGRESPNVETETFEVDDFVKSWKEWEIYTSNLWDQVYRSLPLWKSSRLLLNQT